MQRKLDDDMLMLNIVTKSETNGGKRSEKALICKIRNEIKQKKVLLVRLP